MSLLLLLTLHLLCLLHVEKVKLCHKLVVPDEGRCAVWEFDLLLVERQVVNDMFHLGSPVQP